MRPIPWPAGLLWTLACCLLAACFLQHLPIATAQVCTVYPSGSFTSDTYYNLLGPLQDYGLYVDTTSTVTQSRATFASPYVTATGGVPLVTGSCPDQMGGTSSTDPCVMPNTAARAAYASLYSTMSNLSPTGASITASLTNGMFAVTVTPGVYKWDETQCSGLGTCMLTVNDTDPCGKGMFVFMVQKYFQIVSINVTGYARQANIVFVAGTPTVGSCTGALSSGQIGVIGLDGGYNNVRNATILASYYTWSSNAAGYNLSVSRVFAGQLIIGTTYASATCGGKGPYSLAFPGPLLSSVLATQVPRTCADYGNYASCAANSTCKWASLYTNQLYPCSANACSSYPAYYNASKLNYLPSASQWAACSTNTASASNNATNMQRMANVLSMTSWSAYNVSAVPVYTSPVFNLSGINGVGQVVSINAFNVSLSNSDYLCAAALSATVYIPSQSTVAFTCDTYAICTARLRAAVNNTMIGNGVLPLSATCTGPTQTYTLTAADVANAYFPVTVSVYAVNTLGTYAASGTTSISAKASLLSLSVSPSACASYPSANMTGTSLYNLLGPLAGLTFYANATSSMPVSFSAPNGTVVTGSCSAPMQGSFANTSCSQPSFAHTAAFTNLVAALSSLSYTPVALTSSSPTATLAPGAYSLTSSSVTTCTSGACALVLNDPDPCGNGVFVLQWPAAGMSAMSISFTAYAAAPRVIHTSQSTSTASSSAALSTMTGASFVLPGTYASSVFVNNNQFAPAYGYINITFDRMFVGAEVAGQVPVPLSLLGPVFSAVLPTQQPRTCSDYGSFAACAANSTCKWASLYTNQAYPCSAGNCSSAAYTAGTSSTDPVVWNACDVSPKIQRPFPPSIALLSGAYAYAYGDNAYGSSIVSLTPVGYVGAGQNVTVTSFVVQLSVGYSSQLVISAYVQLGAMAGTFVPCTGLPNSTQLVLGCSSTIGCDSANYTVNTSVAYAYCTGNVTYTLTANDVANANTFPFLANVTSVNTLSTISTLVMLAPATKTGWLNTLSLISVPTATVPITVPVCNVSNPLRASRRPLLPSFAQLRTVADPGSTLASSQSAVRSVAVSADGSTMAYGFPFQNQSTGAVWVFGWNATSATWMVQTGPLVGTQSLAGTGQGYAVKLSGDGNLLVTSTPVDSNYNGLGAVWTYVRDPVSTAWSQPFPKMSLTDLNMGTNYGSSLSLSADGRTLAVSVPTSNNANGWVFVYNQTTLGNWTLSSSIQQCGWMQMASNGRVIAVVPLSSTTVWLYTLNLASNTWTGVSFTFPAVNSPFGQNMAFGADATRLVLSSTRDGGNTGAVWTLQQIAGAWQQLLPRLLVTSNPSSTSNTQFGQALALTYDGKVLVVSSQQSDLTGALWVFTWTGAGWAQQLTSAVIHYGGYYFGSAIALAGDGTRMTVANGAGGAPVLSAGVLRAQVCVSAQCGNGTCNDPLSAISMQGLNVSYAASGNGPSSPFLTPNTLWFQPLITVGSGVLFDSISVGVQAFAGTLTYSGLADCGTSISMLNSTLLCVMPTQWTIGSYASVLIDQNSYNATLPWTYTITAVYQGQTYTSESVSATAVYPYADDPTTGEAVALSFGVSTDSTSTIAVGRSFTWLAQNVILTGTSLYLFRSLISINHVTSGVLLTQTTLGGGLPGAQYSTNGDSTSVQTSVFSLAMLSDPTTFSPSCGLLFVARALAPNGLTTLTGTNTQSTPCVPIDVSAFTSQTLLAISPSALYASTQPYVAANNTVTVSLQVRNNASVPFDASSLVFSASMYASSTVVSNVQTFPVSLLPAAAVTIFTVNVTLAPSLDALVRSSTSGSGPLVSASATLALDASTVLSVPSTTGFASYSPCQLGTGNATLCNCSSQTRVITYPVLQASMFAPSTYTCPSVQTVPCAYMDPVCLIPCAARSSFAQCTANSTCKWASADPYGPSPCTENSCSSYVGMPRSTGCESLTAGSSCIAYAWNSSTDVTTNCTQRAYPPLGLVKSSTPFVASAAYSGVSTSPLAVGSTVTLDSSQPNSATSPSYCLVTTGATLTINTNQPIALDLPARSVKCSQQAYGVQIVNSAQQSVYFYSSSFFSSTPYELDPSYTYNVTSEDAVTGWLNMTVSYTSFDILDPTYAPVVSSVTNAYRVQVPAGVAPTAAANITFIPLPSQAYIQTQIQLVLNLSYYNPALASVMAAQLCAEITDLTLATECSVVQIKISGAIVNTTLTAAQVLQQFVSGGGAQSLSSTQYPIFSTTTQVISTGVISSDIPTDPYYDLTCNSGMNCINNKTQCVRGVCTCITDPVTDYCTGFAGCVGGYSVSSFADVCTTTGTTTDLLVYDPKQPCPSRNAAYMNLYPNRKWCQDPTRSLNTDRLLLTGMLGNPNNTANPVLLFTIASPYSIAQLLQLQRDSITGIVAFQAYVSNLYNGAVPTTNKAWAQVEFRSFVSNNRTVQLTRLMFLDEVEGDAQWYFHNNQWNLYSNTLSPIPSFAYAYWDFSANKATWACQTGRVYNTLTNLCEQGCNNGNAGLTCLTPLSAFPTSVRCAVPEFNATSMLYLSYDCASVVCQPGYVPDWNNCTYSFTYTSPSSSSTAGNATSDLSDSQTDTSSSSTNNAAKYGVIAGAAVVGTVAAVIAVAVIYTTFFAGAAAAGGAASAAASVVTSVAPLVVGGKYNARGSRSRSVSRVMEERRRILPNQRKPKGGKGLSSLSRSRSVSQVRITLDSVS